jgi:hypothetical protein
MIRADHPMNKCPTLLQSLITTSLGAAFYDAGHMGDALVDFCYPAQ